ncbi:MAG: helix-turn-helix transcriptional regulator [Sphingopyxis sp.]|nr:helix-turn-helix transcriptional regulator [Sphingopyxis sp.]
MVVQERSDANAVKTDARRNAILAAATDIFREVGYARASMAMISARLGGSKGTLYGYFKSKEELFGAAMMEVMEGAGGRRGAPPLMHLNPISPSSCAGSGWLIWPC